MTPSAEHNRLNVLASVSHEFAMVATNYDALLKLIARSTADFVGDSCLVTLVQGTKLVDAANAHRDPLLERDFPLFTANVELDLTTNTGFSAKIVRTGEPVLVPVIDPARVIAGSEPHLRPLITRLNPHGFAAVAIRARSTILGTLTAFRCGPGRPYTADDLVLLQDLGDRAGLAIENARLYRDLERRVRERTADLEATNRELESFSYSVAHDLRAPLRSIDSFSRAVLEDHAPELGEDGRTNLGRVLGAARHMSTLIDDLLDLSRVTSAELNRHDVEVTALAESVIARLRETEPDRRVDVEIQPGMRASADPRLLEVVLTNVLGNAWKFTGKRAHAHIRFVTRPETSPTIFAIEDDGAGFDDARATTLFGVFQRFHLASDFEGTGIGLATVKRIVVRHGGRISARAAVDQGATFEFTIEPG